MWSSDELAEAASRDENLLPQRAAVGPTTVPVQGKSLKFSISLISLYILKKCFRILLYANFLSSVEIVFRSKNI